MRFPEYTARVLVFVGVVAAVVAAATAAPSVLDVADRTGPGTVRTPDDAERSTVPDEFRPEEIAPEPIDESGEVTVAPALGAENDSDRKRILIDTVHGNRFEREDVRPLVRALVTNGHAVRFGAGGFNATFNRSDALVVIDPEEPYSPDEIRATRRFVRDGGRVLIVGEPDRHWLTLTGVETRRSRLAALAAGFGISYTSEYLYDMTTNDGNFQHVVAKPSPESPVAEEVDRVAMYTAAAVDIRLGRTVLHTARTTRIATVAPGGRHAVAVRHRNGNVLAVGDKTFLGTDRYTVADNEAFVGYLAEFLLTGNETAGRSGPTGPTGDNRTTRPD